MADLLIHGTEVSEGVVTDVRIRQGRVIEIADSLRREAREDTIEARGGALLPGLHDHHIHLFALAAARASIACGPPDVTNAEALSRVLTEAARERDSIRGVAYHESVAGNLERHTLDALGPKQIPVRIQHRSGALWILNSAAIDAYDLERSPSPAGAERDASGRLTGRIYYEDAWLRQQIGAGSFPDLASVGRELASCGVTAVMDATPDKGPADFAALEQAVERGDLRQHITAMGSLGLDSHPGARVELGPVKIMLREPALPEFDTLVETLAAAHAQERNVAFHCVTRAELVMACGALREAGPRPGDRIEHASIASPDLVEWLAELNVTVVTQPGFVFERGATYLRDVEPADRPWLYRGRGFIDGGVALGAGTDAPYGSPDPWVAIRAAVNRRTRTGAVLGADEALSPERALALFTSPIVSPGATPPVIDVGIGADLCLLDRPWRDFRDQLDREHVVLTICRGEVIWRQATDRLRSR